MGSRIAPPTDDSRSHAAPATALTRYVGGKNGEGVWQRLISMMPPHRDYIEAFLGSGAIIRRKRPAPGLNVGIELDVEIAARHLDRPYRVVCEDALEWLRGFVCGGTRAQLKRTLVYCDPPYLGAARACPRRACYKHEMKGGFEHAELLQILTTIPAMVMISGYAHPQYELALAGWRRVEYPAMTRGGLKTEVVWCNFEEPQELHDYRFLGRDFRERCRIRRKIARWVANLQAMPALERAAVLAALGGGPEKL